VACRSEFFTADAAGMLLMPNALLSEQGFASVTVTTDAEPGNGCARQAARGATARMLRRCDGLNLARPHRKEFM